MPETDLVLSSNFLNKQSGTPNELNCRHLAGIGQTGHRPANIVVCSPSREHEHNGSSEKTIRDIGDLDHTTTASVALPSDGWTHTYGHWTWLTSRPPAENYIVNVHYMMFDKNFRNFGCRVFAQIPKAQRHGRDPQAAGDAYVGHNDASSTYLIYISGTYGTRIEGTPAFIEDVDAYAPRLHNSSSVQADRKSVV